MRKESNERLNVLPSDLMVRIYGRIELLRRIIAQAEAQYASMPEGKLHVLPGKSEDHFRYYVRIDPSDKTGEYLDKNCERLKELYAGKRYYEELLKNTRDELAVWEKAASRLKGDSILNAYEKQSMGVRQLINPFLMDDETFIRKWESIPYEGLPFSENDKSSHYSEKKERMRSKREVLIANALEKRGIPYKYECPIVLKNGVVRYPDFTVLSLKERKIKIWEHLGRMGDMEYVRKNLIKLDEYKQYGFVLGKDLLLSYEFYENQLGAKEIEDIIGLI